MRYIKMDLDYLKGNIVRHIDETSQYINQLTDELIFQEPVKDGRPIGEIILHMIRSLEFYSRGIAENIWEPLAFKLTEYNTADKIAELYKEVKQRVINYFNNYTSDLLDEKIEIFNRPATKKEIFNEMLEHSIHHRGQISVYFRLLELEPPKIEYII
ncbi:MAG: DinB family protein [Candidatus Heimdallarchaeaceae archaeon]|jgi:uncharacterized damage-inducible protein DinB